MGGRRSTGRKMLWRVCLLAVIAVAQSRPSSGRSVEEGGVGVNAFLDSSSRRRMDRARGIFRDNQVRLERKAQKEADDSSKQWRMDWWSEQEKADEKENWKVFNTDKKAVKQRWWEEDWKDDEWWSPKDSNNNNNHTTATTTATTTTSPTTTTTTTTATILTTSRTKYSNRKKKGEAQRDSGKKQVMKMKKSKKHQKQKAEAEHASQLQTSPPAHRGQTVLPAKTPRKSKAKKASPEREVMPEGESPWEKLGPVWDGEVLISPFEDPKPAPVPESRDEGPSHHLWEHHQLTGLGRYIDHKDSAKAQPQHPEDQNDVHPHKKARKEIRKPAKLPKKSKPTFSKEDVEQFYGFGLESTLSAPANELKDIQKPQRTSAKKPHKPLQPRTTKKKPSNPDSHKDEPPTQELPEQQFSEDNYNKGVIYDIIPAPSKKTHPSQKNLIVSVKTDAASMEHDTGFISTKASPQTSPNPPPPDLAHGGPDSETTPVVPRKRGGRKGPNKHYVKSRPLTFCKLPTDCRKGRKCRRGLCVCLAEGECKGRKAVCGSDGVQYASHCELHRTACLTRRHIKVDRAASCAPPETTAPPEVTTADDHTTTTTPTTTTTTTPSTTTSTTTTSTTPTTTPESSSTTVSQEFGDNDGDEEDDDDGFYNEDDNDIFDDDDYEDNYEYEYYDEDYDEDVNDEEDEEADEDEEEEEEEDEDEENEHNSNGADIDSRVNLDSSRQTAPPESRAQEETTQRNNRVSKGEKKNARKGDNQVLKLSKADDHPDFKSSQKGEEESQKDYDYQSDASSFLECTKKELKKFKRQLLSFYCQRFQEPDCKLGVKEERDYLSNLLFSYLDMNTDYQVSFRELRARQASPHLPELSPVCQLTDLIWNDDVQDIDGQLSLQEFAEAFAHLYDAEKDDKEEKYRQENRQTSSSSSSSSPSSPVVNIIPTLATVGNGLELKCGLDASGAQVVWKRHGVNIRDLDLAELLVLEDGSLFFSKMGVHHMGNYSCQDVSDPSILQVHSLKVQMPPIVKVSPHSQIQPSKAEVRLRCHAEGVPRPSITWQMNHLALHTQPHRYSLAGNKEQLTIYEADYQKDTGAYKCVARNQAGTAQDLASLFIIGDKDRTMGMGFTNANAGKFAVFHSQGYTTYDPNDCLKHSTVHGDFGYFKFIPDSLDRPLRLCEVGGECVWGQVVNVRNSLLYVTQPTLNRVVVIETAKNWIPVQVIATDQRPMQVYYVPQLDQVWVVCWSRGEEGEGEEGGGEESNKTLVVVRDASKFIQHRVVHTQPVGNRFDQIQALFIAPANDLQHTYDYGYVTHSGQQTLTKVDLDNMRYVNTIHLSAYDCVPRSLAFVPIGGHVVVECVSSSSHQTLQLVLDYLTDAVVSTGLVSGRPHVSPDSRHVVTVDDLTGKVSVAGVSNEGTLEAAYEVTVSASISDVAFFPALGHGYLLVLTSADDDDIITINLSTGKVDKMKGTTRRATSSDWYPSPVKRAIISGDVFSDFLLAPSKSSLSIMAMGRQQVQCEYPATQRLHTAVFVRP